MKGNRIMTPSYEEFQFTSFKFYRVYHEVCAGLPADKQLKFLSSIYEYVFERKEPEFSSDDSEVETAFMIIKTTLDRSMRATYRRGTSLKAGGE